MTTADRTAVMRRLTLERARSLADVEDAIDRSEVVGLLGDGQVGKTTLARHLLRSHDDWTTVELDVSSATSLSQLARQWVLGLASAYVDIDLLDQFSYRAPSDWSLPAHRAAAQLTERFGSAIGSTLTEPAGESRPGRELVADLTRATAKAKGAKPSVIFIDHLEAPGLAFRHPLDISDLLWQIRSVLQYGDPLTVVMSCRPPAADLAIGTHAAFYGEGEWIHLDPPTAAQFAIASEQPLDVVHDVLQFTRGHVNTTIDVLQRINSRRKIFGVVHDVVSEQRDLVSRTLEYARSLHRLGGRLLYATASGRGPYKSLPEENPNAIAKAMRTLHLAGLVTQPQEGRWQLVDPRVEMWLGGGAITHGSVGTTFHVFSADDD